jgi:hypothetical protein
MKGVTPMDPESALAVQESQRNFARARMSAFWEEVRGLLTGKSIDLLRFEEVKHALRLHDERYLGLQEIPVEKIVGSVGRYRDFTRSFLPRTNSVRSRWARLDAMARGPSGFPPIEVYKIGAVYFVIDGNHRVSVAKQLDALTIEAYVTELPSPIAIDQNTTPDDLEKAQGLADFLAHTNIHALRPDAQIHLTEPGRYRQLLEHIKVHRYFLCIEKQHDVPYSEAVASWYDHVYMPMIELIRKHSILEHFPDRTEADLYAWLIKHQEALRLAYGGEWLTPEETVTDFIAKIPE